MSSGDPFQITTGSWLQWLLHRIRALAAVAGYHDSEDTEEEDDSGIRSRGGGLSADLMEVNTWVERVYEAKVLFSRYYCKLNP